MFKNDFLEGAHDGHIFFENHPKVQTVSRRNAFFVKKSLRVLILSSSDVRPNDSILRSENDWGTPE